MKLEKSNINNTNNYCLWRVYSICDCIILSVTPCGLYYDCYLIESNLIVREQESVASQAMLLVKNPPAYAGDTRDTDSISGLGRYSGAESGNPLQCSCLGNPMDRGAWWAKSLSTRVRVWALTRSVL